MNQTTRWKRQAGPLVVALLFGLSLGATAAPSKKYDHEEVIEKRYEVRPGQSLILDSDLGSVRIRGGTEREVIIKVVKGADDVSKRRAKELFERFALEFRQTERGVEITGEYDRPGGWFRRNRLRVEYDIRVPREFNVEVRTAGGSIDVRDLRGEASVKTSGGSIKLIEITGPVVAKTSGGSITAEGVGGEATVKTSGGSIRLRRVNGPATCKTSGGTISAEEIHGRVDAHTSGGTIRLVDIYGEVDASTSGGSIHADIAVQPKGPVRIKTSGGSITLRLEPDVKADIEAKTSGGRVRCELPVEVQGEASRRHLQARLNGGGPLITLKTSGGSIHIRQR